jgi:hypothetical protein
MQECTKPQQQHDKYAVGSQHIVGYSTSCLPYHPASGSQLIAALAPALTKASVRSMHFTNFACWGQHGPSAMASLEEVLVLEPLQGTEGVAGIRSCLRGGRGLLES